MMQDRVDEVSRSISDATVTFADRLEGYKGDKTALTKERRLDTRALSSGSGPAPPPAVAYDHERMVAAMTAAVRTAVREEMAQGLSKELREEVVNAVRRELPRHSERLASSSVERVHVVPSSETD